MRAITCIPRLIQQDNNWDFGPQEIARHKLSKWEHNVPMKTFCEATCMEQY
jgi:hypothetical protein